MTLPLDEFLARRSGDAAVEAVPGPPVAFAVARAEVDSKLTGGELTGVASFAVTAFADGWHLVPLIGGAVRVGAVAAGRTAVPTSETARVSGTMAYLAPRAAIGQWSDAIGPLYWHGGAG